MRELAIIIGILGMSACAGQIPAPAPQPSLAPAASCAPCPEPSPCVVKALPCEAPVIDALVTTGDDTLELQDVPFSALPGWRKDTHGEAIGAFAASCTKLADLADDEPIGSGPYAGLARDWRAACAAAAQTSTRDHAQARTFFETHFKAYAALGNAGAQGKFTGYYVQPLRASRKRGGRYQFPLYRRPPDLVAVPLSDFVSDGRGRRIWGRLGQDGKSLVPHLPRAEYRKQRAGQDEVLLWLDSPSDVLLLEIEGSGKAVLDDGSTAMVAFAGKNGHSAAGRARPILRAVQAMQRKHKGGAWSARDVAQYHSLVDHKDSMVFFEIESRPGAIGTQDVILTPKRSVAVDRAVIALSTPVWIETSAPRSPTGSIEEFRQLLIAQDTGGAIIGTVRADIYFGDDQAAMDMGRRVRSGGRMWLLLPKELQVPTLP